MIMIGALRQRLTIQQESQVADGAGGYALSWNDVATLWGSVEPNDGREIRIAGRLEGRVTHRMMIRTRTDITTAMRVSWGGRIFNIRAVIQLGERNPFTQLLVEEGGAS